MKFIVRWSCAALSMAGFTELSFAHQEEEELMNSSKPTVADPSQMPELTSQPFQNNRYLFDPHAMKKSDNFWIEGDLLFLQSNIGGLDYGLTSSSTTTITNGHVKEPHFGWDWGFRLGLGYKLPYDKWDLFFNYAYIQGKASGSTHQSKGAIYPQLVAPFTISLPAGETLYATQAQANWKGNINIADIELGRNCFAGRWLDIRPFVGIRGLFVDQKYRVQYRGGTAVPVSDEDQVSIDHHFWGVGMRMGFDSLWGLGAGWAVYGNGAASLLSGHFDIRQDEKLNKSGTRKVNISDDMNNIIVAAELALGIQWDYLFSKDRYHFGVKFGWEFDLFFDQNQMIRFVSSTSPGSFSRSNEDLSFQGLTFGMRFDF
jgi:hypothetical protein